MSRFRIGASRFEQQCIVANATRHPLCEGVISDSAVQGDYYFDTLALRQAPIADADELAIATQRAKALSNINRILASAPSPGFASRFKLLDLVESLPPCLQQQKAAWMSQGPYQTSEVIAEQFDDSAYVVQAVVGSSIGDIYRVPLPPVQGELAKQQQVKQQFDELWQDLVPIIYYLQYLHQHGVVHINICPETVIRTPNKQIKITGLQDTFRSFQVGEQAVDQIQPRVYLNEYSPPEILLGQAHCYIALTDTWMVGMLAYFMATRGRNNPFGINKAVWKKHDSRIEALRGLYAKNRSAKSLPINFNYAIFHTLRGQRLKSFIETCLSPDAMTRVTMTVNKMFRHPLFTNDENTNNAIKHMLDACEIDKDLFAAVNCQSFEPEHVRSMTFNAAKRYLKTRANYGYRRATVAARPTYGKAIKSISPVQRAVLVAVVVIAIGAAVTVAVLAPPLAIMIAVCAGAAVITTGAMATTGAVVHRRVKKSKKALSELYKMPDDIDDEVKPTRCDQEQHQPLLLSVDRSPQRGKRLSAKISMTFAMPSEGYETVDLDDENGDDGVMEQKCCLR
ncbi:MAG: hypothetical protein P1U40_10390 [Coxiellaceae bacterium]|nr:hypothetical protein [Coxiellaceae bacterium]